MVVLMILLLMVLLAVWVALPLVPAVLIYRLFPTTSVFANGPLANLTINTSGAFAAYLVVFLITTPMVNAIKNAIGGETRPSWEIHGQVKLVDQGKPILRQDLLTTMRLEARPDVLGHFGATLVLKIPEEDGYFPEVLVHIPDWGYGSVDLNRQGILDKVFRNWSFRRVVDVGEVKIERIPESGKYEARSDMALPVQRP
jgi:hypothetical protein